MAPHAAASIVHADASDARDAPTVRLPAFVGTTLAWLVPAFALWYFAAPILVAPAVLLVRLVARAGLADVVRTIEQSGSVATFVTTLASGTPASHGVVTVDVNMLVYSFGLPLFAALTLAARERAWKRHLAIGYAALLPCVALPALADFLKSVAITAKIANTRRVIHMQPLWAFYTLWWLMTRAHAAATSAKIAWLVIVSAAVTVA